MSTATKTRATRTKADATATAKSASNDVKRTSRSARAATDRTSREVLSQGRRVTSAAQAEVAAVAKQPTRPLMFALGLVDRSIATAKTVPAAVKGAPGAVRGRVVGTVTTVGDLAERAQRGYTEVAKDGESLVAAVRRQDSTQRAQRLAERAARRGRSAVRDTELAVEAAGDAVTEAVSKLG